MVGYYIDKAWWQAFANEPMIAATSFLAIPGGKRSPGVKKGDLALWLQEMKNPPYGEAEILNSVNVVPLQASPGLSLSDAVAAGGTEAVNNTAEMAGTKGRQYQWDGNFAPNANVLGSWLQVGGAKSIDDYKPGSRLSMDKSMPEELTFLENGRTSRPELGLGSL